MSRYQYAIASGWNIALSSLINLEDLSQFRVDGVFVPPRSQPVNAYPVRRITLAGTVYGTGRIDHEWRWSVLPIAAITYLEDLLSFSSAASAQCTINTRRHNRGVATYARYNAYAEIFTYGGARFGSGSSAEYRAKHFVEVALRFYGLVEAT